MNETDSGIVNVNENADAAPVTVETAEATENVENSVPVEVSENTQAEPDSEADAIEKSFINGFGIDTHETASETAQNEASQGVDASQGQDVPSSQEVAQRPQNVAVEGVQKESPEQVGQTGQTGQAEQTGQTGQGEQREQKGQDAPVNQNNQHSPPQSPRMPRAVSEAEWAELAEAHPEIIGQKLPNEIFKACIMSDKSPLQIYESMMLKETQSQVAYLNAENARLKKELENFHRAPVVPTEGSAVKQEPKDPILEAFMRYE